MKQPEPGTASATVRCDAAGSGDYYLAFPNAVVPGENTGGSRVVSVTPDTPSADCTAVDTQYASYAAETIIGVGTRDFSYGSADRGFHLVVFGSPPATAASGPPSVTGYTAPSIDFPYAIAAGPDGALWFTNFSNNSIGRITTSGTVTNYTGNGINHPEGIAAGPDGAMWFANGYAIGRITMSGTLTFYQGVHQQVMGIAAGPDGAVWFTEGYLTKGSIGRITT
jgi:streptogramin lyase